MAAGHVGGGPRLIDENEALGIEIELTVEPALPLPQDVGAVLLDSMASLYGMARPFSPASVMMSVLEKERSGPMTIVILGVDLGKNACSVVGVDAAGAVVLRRSMRRQTLIDYVAKLPTCVVAMEACCGAHYLGRLFAAQGHEIRLMSPEYVRPYVKAQKNDDRDAEGIAEAASRPTMRFVELKSEAQLDIQTLHRVRSRLVNERKNLINQMRAILLERGTTFPVGRRKFEQGIDAMLADEDTTLSPRLRQLMDQLRAEWRELDARIEALNGEFIELARNDAAARRLMSIPGVGVLNATALIAAVGNASSFAKARDLGAWLGLVPRQHTTGGKPRLLGISKRGNTYLRTLLIHGARAALPSLARSETPLGRWLTGMIERGVHRNAIVVALANKLARIAWAALRKEATFERGYPVAA
jgi:transposase